MSDDKTPIEQAVDQAVDAFVYAPIGLLFDGPALFPKLVQQGKNQVQVARMMGEMAVQMGQTEAAKRVGEAQGQVREALVGLGLVPAPKKPAASPEPATAPEPKPSPSEPAESTSAAAKKTPAKKSTAKKSTAKSGKKAAAKKSAAAKAPSVKIPAVGSLSIPDYDSLSASQVVSRLRGLADPELAAVAAYETAKRGRKTVLNKVAQLQKP